MYWSEKVLITGTSSSSATNPSTPPLTKQKNPLTSANLSASTTAPQPRRQYWRGSVAITGNLFINELADRPSVISIDACRDVLVSGNKSSTASFANTTNQPRQESDANRDMDEFAAHAFSPKENGVAYRMLRYAGSDASRVTGHRQRIHPPPPGDNPPSSSTAPSPAPSSKIHHPQGNHLPHLHDPSAKTKKARPASCSIRNNSRRPRTHLFHPCHPPSHRARIDRMTLVPRHIIEGWVKSITRRSPENTLSDTSHLSLLVTATPLTESSTSPPPPPVQP
ncbi:hypothetical protein Ga0100230_018080 [Opitutaceae bacterium TAV3]|nr:hypothetical protein Ga0100230_018080 [Opitutaceae bacterium TAV3]